MVIAMIDRLIEAIKAKQNPTVAGLDTRLEYLPQSFLDGLGFDVRDFSTAAQAILQFNKNLVDALADVVPAVKVQIAYYEMYGVAGVECFYQTCAYAKAKDLVVMADAKRNDIGATAEAYSNAFLGKTPVNGQMLDAFNADMLTVNPYLGIDGIAPFVADCKKQDKGIFVLVKTSNVSSGDFQDLYLADGRQVFEAVGDKVAEWGQSAIGKYGYSDVGAVVGATYPQQGAKLRARLPGVFFLIPGYGAQGAMAQDVALMFDEKGTGGIVNASRSLLLAYQKAGTQDFAAAAREEALRMQADLLQALRSQNRWPV